MLVMAGSPGGPLKQSGEVQNTMCPSPEVFCLPLVSRLTREDN
ncbi:hypothetical protein RRSWK_02746 [Rhodopirellula sp. SWK7]|nr:hypothetical protein RRSWK_02746 [Rhodopirellula sp. SWK7]